ncbi:MAG: FtsH protease activity modulator HflK [Holosporaceae bacterium]|jgi:membrane protease subunit HflK|nr:FtsH protease activity modulator HflK [Holosporaceae bacterium]
MSSENPWDNSNGKKSWKQKKIIGKFSLNLDKILKKINGDQNARENYGKGNNGGGGSSLGIGWPALLILGALYFFSGFYQVEHDECGVVLRFGRCVRTVGPGLHYILPYPFEEAILQRTTAVNQIDIGFVPKNQQDENLMLTGDSNLANVSFSVLWKIKDNGIRDYLFNAKSPEVTVQAVAESVMREIVGQTPFTYVQTEGRADIQKKAKDSLQSLMNEYRIGVEIVRVELQRVEPPASVVDSFRDVERAQAEQQSVKNKAEAYDRDKKARTRGIVAEKINNGEATKQKIIEAARGVSVRFLAALQQYKLSPDIVSKRMYLDAMRDIYIGSRKIFIDDGVKVASYLPLSELMGTKKMMQFGEVATSRNDATPEASEGQKTVATAETDKEKV